MKPLEKEAILMKKASLFNFYNQKNDKKMKSKEELKSFFENGDIPKQDEFWEWQDSYWHKNEKLPLENIDYNFSNKADLVDGKIPATQLPSYVDDILEFESIEDLPNPGEGGKIYVITSSNTQLRWSGSEYIQIISGENVMITDSPQSIFPNGTKTFWTDGGNSINNNSLWIRNTNSGGAGITFTGNGIGQIIFKDDQFHFTNNDGTNNIPVVSEGFIKSNSSDDYLLTGGGNDKPISDFAKSSQLGDYISYNGANQNINLNNKNFDNIGRITTNKSIRNNGHGISITNVSTSGTNHTNILIKTGAETSNMITFTVNLYSYSNKYYEFQVNLYKYASTHYDPTITWKAGTSSDIQRIEFLTDNNNGILYLNIVVPNNYPRIAITDLQGYTGFDNVFEAESWGIEVDGDTSGLALNVTRFPDEFIINHDDTKINAWENALAIGFTSGNANAAPYIYHSDEGPKTLATEVWTNDSFYTKQEVDAKLSAVYRPKGSVVDFASLPITGNTEGDVWNLLDTGSNYVWTLNLNDTSVPGWDKLSETIDLTAYYTQAQIDHMLGNYATLNTPQNFLSRKSFDGATGNNFNTGAIETRGNGSNIYPSLGFHQPGLYGASLQYRADGFHFMNINGDGFDNVKANAFFKSGSDDNYLLLGGGGHKQISDFVVDADLSGYATLNTPQDITGRKQFITNGGGENWDNNSMTLLGLGGKLAGLTFYSSGFDIGQINFNGYFNFVNDAANTFKPVKAAGYYKVGSDDNYLLLGGGGHKQISDFVLDSDLNNYVDKTTNDQDITGTKNFHTFGGNDYNNNSLNIISTDGSDPAITFNKIGTIAGQIKMNIAGYHFLNPGSAGYYPVNSAGYKKDGSDNNYVLTGGGDHKSLADFLSNRGSGFTSNTDANNTTDIPISSEIYAIELGNGSGNTNFPFDTYGTFMRMRSRTFASDFAHQNDGSLYHRCWYIAASPSSYAFRKIWDDANFNPDTKAGALENATAVGFSNGNIPTEDGSQYPYIAHDTAGFVPIATRDFVNHNFHKINRGAVLINASDTNVNKTWFDYTWAGGSHAGSVISFSGLNDAYATELFGEYNNGGNRFGLRTRNGDVNAWNPAVWICTSNTPQTIEADKTIANTAKFNILGNEGNLNNTQSFNTTGTTGNIVSGWINTFYDNQWRYGIARGGSSSSDGIKFGFDLSVDGGSAYTRMLSIDGSNGSLLLKSGGKIDQYGCVTIKQTTIGAHAAGFYWENKDGSGNSVASTGALFNDGDYQYSYIGWGTTPWVASSCLAIGENTFLYKGNQIWHEGNFNPTDYYTAVQVNNFFIEESQKGAANGIAPLGSDSKISSAYLPSYVDDVLEFSSLSSFPATGESGKIYVALDTNLTYRWGGSSYTQIAAGAVQSVNGHVGIVTLGKSDVGLANTDNTSDATKNVLSATKWTTSRTLSYTGDVTGSASVDGTGNVGFVMTLANSGVSAGTYNSVNVDAKGRVLSGNNINYVTESYLTTLLQQNYFNQSASDERFVNSEGDEVINGNKTFTSSPSIPVATHGDHAVNLEQLTASLSHVINDNDSFKTLEEYRLIDSNPIDLDNTDIKKYNIVFDGSSNGSVNINHLRDNQYYQFSNVSGSGADLEINVEGYGLVDMVSSGKTFVYMSWGSGKLLRISANENTSII